MSAKSHYELLGLDASADADTIKKAFRREIARYHPDKVIHLGAEFQQMASVRAAELTIAYKTLTDPAMRAEYDATLSVDAAAPALSRDPGATVAEPSPAPEFRPEPEPERPASRRDSGRRFAAERADRDVILKRAVATRVRGIVEALYGSLETPVVRGFDLAMVPVAKAGFFGTAPPRVLVKVVDVADAAAITDAFANASRSRIHVGKSPVVVLLFSRKIASQQEISKANESNARQRKTPEGPAEVAVVPVDIADWSCRLPPNCSSAVHKLTQQVCL